MAVQPTTGNLGNRGNRRPKESSAHHKQRPVGSAFTLAAVLTILPSLRSLAAAATPARPPATAPAVAPASAPAPAAADSWETRTGQFTATYPLPPEADSTRLVELQTKRLRELFGL